MIRHWYFEAVACACNFSKVSASHSEYFYNVIHVHSIIIPPIIVNVFLFVIIFNIEKLSIVQHNYKHYYSIKSD